MSVTPIDLDDEALAKAMRELGTTTKKETVNTALREVAERHSRLRAFDELLHLAADGAFEDGYRDWRFRKGLDAESE